MTHNDRRRITNTYTNPHKHPFMLTYPSLCGVVHNIYQYQLNYNHNHRPISVWDGTTHTDIVYNDDDDIDDDDDDDYTDYAYDDYDPCGATLVTESRQVGKLLTNHDSRHR